MRWKLFAILTGVLYLNSLFHWFRGDYAPTLLHYGMLVVQLPLLAATFCYAFDRDLASVRTWRLSLSGLALLLVAKIIEGIAPLVRVYEIAPRFTTRAIAEAYAFILFFDIFDLLILCVQGVALWRYIRRLDVRRMNAKVPPDNSPRLRLRLGLESAKSA
ncbi:hypothetical protein [Rhizobium phaseoli]|uniref:hypothetical protein n=1 Tax=Rhizobium phaseoli TaxID=396 RepID=UPI000BE91624|nr:hypothetical protein [Rhizobium phaseoli]MDK4725208.1 hypothetical protein [Rhizobium phaseoli]NKE87011.1 hypothetical protein [Rhizobium phaseoli]PDS74345.1 hypothetical protein CO651_01140 [Rhizobium phaseoli]